MMESIQKYIAWQLCAEIWKENQGKWYTLKGLQCWNCSRSSPMSPANRCVSKLASLGARAVALTTAA